MLANPLPNSLRAGAVGSGLECDVGDPLTNCLGDFNVYAEAATNKITQEDFVASIATVGSVSVDI